MSVHTPKTSHLCRQRSRGSLLTVTLSLGLLAASEPAAAQIVPVCDRTPEVRDEIVKLVPDVSDCTDVTEAHLATIEGVLDLRGQHLDSWATLTGLIPPISELKAGDFSGLSSLEWISLDYNQLSSLPPDLFSGLSSLRILELEENQLISLPPDLFSGLSELNNLYLDYNQLTSLPDGLFVGLSSLRELRLEQGELRLEQGELRQVSFWRSPIIVSLERVGESQFLAKAHTGAPFEFVLPITSFNGEIEGDTSSIVIPAGSHESAVYTISRRTDVVSAVSVNISDLPRLPHFHYGYELVKSPNLPLIVHDALVPNNM